ncbi:MAG: hypothetical protein BRC58_10045 [Cyanobacteria bacterium QS_8_64_29]|nr:MAG: hypothetical protein BRC58_10045 [Cyanobacteria bacterium QS_8_64_29]
MTQVSPAALIASALAGEAVSFPTDTVPALAALPEQAKVLFELKGRDRSKPLILMAAAAAELWPYARGSAAEFEAWQQIAQAHWPGPLTLVLPASAAVPAALNPSDPGTIGMRVPNCRTARTILARTGPLATTSANRSGEPSLTRLSAVTAAFPGIAVLAADASETASGQPSTVARWNGTDWTVLRQGPVRLTGSNPD